MSDIALRFDGLLFCLVIIASGALLSVIGLAFGGHARWGKGNQRRSARIARACTIGVGACLLSFGALVFYMDRMPGPITGPDWLDWVALPWAAILLGGLIRLARKPAR